MDRRQNGNSRMTAVVTRLAIREKEAALRRKSRRVEMGFLRRKQSDRSRNTSSGTRGGGDKVSMKKRRNGILEDTAGLSYGIRLLNWVPIYGGRTQRRRSRRE